jgi:hypothetical protein
VGGNGAAKSNVLTSGSPVANPKSGLDNFFNTKYFFFNFTHPRSKTAVLDHPLRSHVIQLVRSPQEDETDKACYSNTHGNREKCRRNVCWEISRTLQDPCMHSYRIEDDTTMAFKEMNRGLASCGSS